jgi:spore coat protein CotH
MFKKAMNIEKDRIVAQITDEEIEDDIQLLELLKLIETKAKEPYVEADDPDVEKELKYYLDVRTLLILLNVDKRVGS